MKTEITKIHQIPAVLYGEPSKKGYLFIHGQGGNKEEAAEFAEIAVPAGYQVLGIDLPGHGVRKGSSDAFVPWTVIPELRAVLAERKTHWSSIALRANSIGAYFSMLAFAGEPIEKSLFVSPIVNMEQLIVDMMSWAGVTEAQLHEQGEISTTFGQTLSWHCLCWARQHPLDAWNTPTFLLYAGHDNLTARQTIANFAKAHSAVLTVYAQGEHWFHTPEQLDCLCHWEQSNL